MMSQIEVRELVQHLPDVMAAIANGEEVILTDAEAPIAKLVKIEEEMPGRTPGSAVGLFTMSDDFDEPIETISQMPLHHKDPFDRLLIAQSLVYGMPIVSSDPKFDAYGVNRIW